MGLKVLMGGLLVAKSIDKIRPKWDWKVSVSELFDTGYNMIKSDQNGIER